MISDEQKIYITNGYDKNYSSSVIGDILGLSAAAVRQFWSRKKAIADLPPKVVSLKRKITASMGIAVKNHILQTPKTSQAKILKAANRSVSASKKISRTTVRRFLIDNKLVKKKSTSKPILTDATRKKRLGFVNKWLRNGVNLLGSVIWTDETTVKSHPNTRRESAYVHAKDPPLFQSKVHSGGLSQMFWGCFSKNGTGPLITIDGTMDQFMYKKVLREQLLPELRAAKKLGGEWRLMHDNAPSHKANSIKAYLAEEKVEMIEWPPYSPDMNPIENVWAWMKQKLANDYTVCTNQKDLEENFMEIWESITPDMCIAFCGNYEKRLEAVKIAKGGPTKY